MRRHGQVIDFDDRKGFGTIRDAGGSEHFFHCTAVADGSRTIAVGTVVSFDVVAGQLGRWEASDVRPG